MSYRRGKTLREEYAGRRAREIHGMISAREAVDHDGQRLTALGREAADGSQETDEMPACSPVGIAAAPAAEAAVTAVVNFIGADGDHPVAVSYVDSTRTAVIDAVGLEADETIVHTSKSVVKILADGTVEIRSLAGSADPLAFVSELEAVNARIDALESAFNTHTHLYAPGPGTPTPTAPPETPSTTSAAINGTQVLRAE